MKTILNITALFICLALVSCDPSLKGESRLFNDSSVVLTIKLLNGSDTVTELLNPSENIVVDIFNRMGDSRRFDCCPFAFLVSIKSPKGELSTFPVCGTIENKDKLKGYGGESIQCEFHILNEHL